MAPPESRSKVGRSLLPRKTFCKLSRMKVGSHTSAVVLEAGTSTRMGTVKQLLRLDDRPLLQHVLDNVRASGVTEIILVLGFAREAIGQEIDVRDARVVINEGFQQGMGTSLKAGLSAVDAQAEAALIVLAHQPFVRPATLDQLITEHQASKAQIVIPTYRGFRGNPVLLDRSVFPEVMALNGDIGCRAIFGNHLQGCRLGLAFRQSYTAGPRLCGAGPAL
jgi:molybdenum cofactor cytidylyltransferase